MYARYGGIFLKAALIAFVLVVPVHFFVAEPFLVSGDSMSPTFRKGDYVVIDHWTYYFHPPQKGDVIVFQYPLDPETYYIKRIVGIPGDTVDETTGAAASVSTTTVTLDVGEYFVLGDNLDVSADSRSWGPLQKKFIVGRVFFRAWPVPR